MNEERITDLLKTSGDLLTIIVTLMWIASFIFLVVFILSKALFQLFLTINY